jgi:energy-coupling factor transporter transmembrane protein EcfT
MKILKDPAARILTVGCISAGTLANSPVWYIALAAIVYTGWTIESSLPPRIIVARLRRALLFLGLIVFLNGFTAGGRVIFEAGGLYLTAEGLTKGAEQALRLSIVLWGALLLVTSDRIEDLQDAAERWTSKKGRPIIAAGTIALAYLPLFIETARRVTIARRARGEQDYPGFSGALRRVAGAAIPLFGSAMRDADALAEAMESRCYVPASARTPFHNSTLNPSGALVVLIAALVTVVAVVGAL